MKRSALNLMLLLALTFSAGCSLPPERPVLREDLYRTRIYQIFTIKDSPDSVLAILNRDGEVVVEGQVKDKPYYIKIFASREGLKWKAFER